jgi:hypothetical protein
VDAERLRDEAPGPVEAAPEPAPPDALHGIASQVGNQGLDALARQGAGILPAGTVHPAVQGALDASRGQGSALDAGTRERFGDLGDLSDVRVHTDERAQQLNQAVSARAFATGSDVFFDAGAYDPGSTAGDRLLAHELAHVVQQRGAPAAGPLPVSQPGDAQEREADAVAERLG